MEKGAPPTPLFVSKNKRSEPKIQWPFSDQIDHIYRLPALVNRVLAPKDDFGIKGNKSHFFLWESSSCQSPIWKYISEIFWDMVTMNKIYLQFERHLEIQFGKGLASNLEELYSLGKEIVPSNMDTWNIFVYNEYQISLISATSHWPNTPIKISNNTSFIPIDAYLGPFKPLSSIV